MTERIIIAGAGGQGIMLLGKVIAEAGMLSGKNVSWFPAYGPEVRGGAAHCLVTLSDEPIGLPQFFYADTAIIMNQPSFIKFRSRLKKGGILVVNSSMVKKSPWANTATAHPFTEIASGLGNVKTANMIALGAYLKKKNALEEKFVEQAMRALAPQGREDLIEINRRALLKGMEL